MSSFTSVDTDTHHDALSHHASVKDTGRMELRIHPRHRTFAKWFDRYMVLVAVFGSVFVYLQAAVIIQNKSSENVSMPSYILFLIVALSWMAYGILWTDWVVALSGVVASIGAILALVATVSYRPSSNPGPFTAMV